MAPLIDPDVVLQLCKTSEQSMQDPRMSPKEGVRTLQQILKKLPSFCFYAQGRHSQSNVTLDNQRWNSMMSVDVHAGFIGRRNRGSQGVGILKGARGFSSVISLAFPYRAHKLSHNMKGFRNVRPCPRLPRGTCERRLCHLPFRIHRMVCVAPLPKSWTCWK